MTNFAIIASPRTGSTHLTHLLNRQKGVICHGEIFRTHSHSGRLPLRWEKDEKNIDAISELSRLRAENADAFLARILAKNGSGESVGFKIFSGQNDVALVALINNPLVKKVILLRRNALAVYSSALIARVTGSRKSKSRQNMPKSRQLVEFRAKQFVRFCGKYFAFYRGVLQRLNQVQERYHVINYDEINDPWHFASLVSFIGAPQSAEHPQAKLMKQNPPDILSRFSNPADASEFLAEHGLSAWEFESETSLDPLQALEGREAAGKGSSANESQQCEDDLPDRSPYHE